VFAMICAFCDCRKVGRARPSPPCRFPNHRVLHAFLAQSATVTLLRF
jgi:hypothetical protein